MAESEGYEQSVSEEARNETLPYSTAEKPLNEAIAEALALCIRFGSGDDHHGGWVVDQIVRKLTGEKYPTFIDFHDLGGIEGIDLNDPEAVAKARQIGTGDYYEGDFTEEEIRLVEDNYYEWSGGIAP